MKKAEAADHWRRACKRGGYIRVEKIAFTNAIGLGTGEIAFRGGLTAICGGNGVGKSTLLEVAELAIAGRLASARAASRHENAQLTATLKLNGEQHELRQTVGVEQETYNGLFKVRRLDPGSEVPHLRRVIARTQNWGELLDALDPRELTEDEVKEISAIVGKSYDQCLVYEIEDIDEAANDEPFPYFIVRSHGSTYSFESMGAGEAALFYTWWHLDRIDSPCALLLEEPESQVAARSQRSLMDLVAKTCDARRVFCIVTTHSADVLSRIPQGHVRLVVRDSGTLQIIDNPDETELMRSLGLKVVKRATVYVEDRAAREFARAIVRLRRPQLSARISILDVGGASELKALLKLLPSALGTVTFGAFDGDQDIAPLLEAYEPHKVVKLPGDVSPEELFQQITDSKKLAPLLTLDETHVAGALASVEGSDHHDWLEDLHKELGVSYDYLMSACAAIWIAEGQNKILADAFVSSIETTSQGK